VQNCLLKSMGAFGCDLSEKPLKNLAKPLTSKLNTRVRFPSPAPTQSMPYLVLFCRIKRWWQLLCLSKMNEISDANRTTAMGLLTDAKEMLAAAELLHGIALGWIGSTTAFASAVRKLSLRSTLAFPVWQKGDRA
jgi:hypothetical protein